MPRQQNEKLPFGSIATLVGTRIPHGLLSVWAIYFITHASSTRIWGQDQTNDYKRRTLILCLYKDLFNVGYERIIKSVNPGFQLRSKTLRHNTKLTRKILSEWSRNQIINEGRRVWDDHRGMLPSRVGLHEVNLLIDSTDFRRSGKQSMSTKDHRWSYKVNGPGQRYTVVMDARGIIQKIWGGYSPKLYDGDWLKLCAGDLLSNFRGAHIIGDVHYELGNGIMKGIEPSPSVKFYVPFSEPRGRKQKRTPTVEDPSLGFSKLTKTQLSWNLKISKLRAQVESPFGRVKSKWEALGGVFYEDEDQQDLLVQIAFGVENWIIRHPNNQ